MNVNKVHLVGRLTRDPEARSTATGQSVTSFGLATNRTWKDKNGQKQEQSEFHNIVLWGRLAEIAGQYLSKGQECYIEGRLQTRSYTGKDNVERRTTEIVAENMQLGSRPQGGSIASGAATSAVATQGTPKKKEQEKEEDIPTINLDEEEKDEIKIDDVPF